MAPKQQFILVICCAITKINKTFQVQEAFVSKVRAELNIISFPDLGNLSDFLSR
jgi:hypothetical protein